MILILNIFVFIFGLIIGSFLNCVIFRLEKKEALTGRSYCPHCMHMLNWIDLVPVVSFLFLRGGCRYCSKKISAQYPLVEIITGLVFLLIFNFQLSPFENSIFYFLFSTFWLYIASSLVVIFVYDLKYYLIPDKVLFPAIIISLIYHFSFNYFLAAIIASGFFYSIYLISKGQWIGFCDVKLAILLGLLLGFPNIFSRLIFSISFWCYNRFGINVFENRKNWT